MKKSFIIPCSVLFFLGNVFHSKNSYAFPIDTEWVPIQKGAASITDDTSENTSNNNGRELVGSTEYPSAYVYHDSTGGTFHVRLRLDSSPSGTGFLAPYGWGILMDTNGDFNSYEYSFMVDGDTESIHLSQNTASSCASSEISCFSTDEVELDLSTPIDIVGNSNVRIVSANSAFSNTADYFLDFSFDDSVFTSTPIETEPLYHFPVIGNSYISGDIDVAGCNTTLLDTCAPDPMYLDGSLFILDTDGDGLSDNDEDNIYYTNKTNEDTDGDGLLDGEEVNTYGSDPNEVDTDGDTIEDYDEAVTYGTNPTLSDSDTNGIPDHREILCFTTSGFDSDFSSANVPGWTLSGDAEFTAFTGVDVPDSGVLRLTDNRVYESTNARFPNPIPTDDGLVFEFQSHVWGGTGGDGYVFFLYNGTQDESTFTEGNYGDGLGYTNFGTGTSQISGAYLGLAFDEEGDFATSVAHSTVLPNSIVLADGSPSYSILDSFTPSFSLYEQSLTERPTIDESGSFLHRTVLKRSTVDSGSFVSSYIQQDSISAYQTLFSDTVQAASIPDSLKMGFSSSTGANTNHHEIGYLKVGRPIDMSVDMIIDWTPVPEVEALGLPQDNVVIAGQELTITATIQNNSSTVITDSSTSLSDIQLKNSTCGEKITVILPENFTVQDMTCLKDSKSFCGVPFESEGSANVFVSLFDGESATFEIVVEVQDVEASTPLNTRLSFLEHEGELDEFPVNDNSLVELVFMPDTDGDGLNDIEEYELGTDRTLVDTDGDGISDYIEVSSGNNPLNADSDGDGLTDGEEDNNQNGVVDEGETDPQNEDSDGDSCSDGVESGLNSFGFLSDPLLLDTDEDGLNDCDEFLIGSNPNSTDSDGDGIDDGEEVNIYGSSPVLEDSDEDGVNDNIEVIIGSDPSSTDSDGDGIPDSIEGVDDLDGDGIENLIDLDSDGDFIPDSIEGNTDFDGDGNIDALDFDSDQDGMRDEAEVPLDGVDSDGDGILDAFDSEPNSLNLIDSTLVERFYLFSSDFDGDGYINSIDRDSDQDGIPDAWEGNTDYDGDGILDQYDLDSDSDGIPDSYEGLFVQPDTDNDGVIDRIDPDSIDSNENGITDCIESNTYCDTDYDGIADSAEEYDTDNDGKGDRVDRDSDGDNIPDTLEAITQRYLGGVDIDSTWTVNNTGTTAGWQLTSTGYQYADYTSILHYRGTHSGTLTSPTFSIPSSDVGVSLALTLMAHHEAGPLQDILNIQLTTPNEDTVFITAEQEWIHGPFSRTYYFPLPEEALAQDALLNLSFHTINSDENETSGPRLEEISFVETLDILDTDNDQLWNHQDTDSDGDGLLDASEEQSDSGSDTDFDQIDNAYDANSLGQSDVNADRIGDDITRAILTDTDEDGLPDSLDLDSDNDGVSDLTESEKGSDPLSDDSDGDGLSDNEELFTHGSDPTSVDTDNDGINDFEEINTHFTNIIDDDSDDDGLTDGHELAISMTDPLLLDTDGDGIQDGTELGRTEGQGVDTDLSVFISDADPSTTTSPTDNDHDDDGLNDGVEDSNHNGAKNSGETFADNPDSDGDGIWDGIEMGITEGVEDTALSTTSFDLDPSTTTNPLDDDSDDDGLSDGMEDSNHNGAHDDEESSPISIDTDGDGIQDGTELGLQIPSSAQTDLNVFIPDADSTTTTLPYDTDTDDDGLSDSDEDTNKDGKQDTNETAPNLPDSDGDGIWDGVELGITFVLADTAIDPITGSYHLDIDPNQTTNPLDADSDDDGLSDGEEDSNTNGAQDTDETNPLSTDSDGDGIQDGTELGLVIPSTADTNSNIFQPDISPATTTDPLDGDDDDDGLFDGIEDANANGKQDANETAAHLADTDGDGIQDGTELGVSIPTTYTGEGFVADSDISSTTSPIDNDSDDDGISDGEEDSNANGAQDTDETNPLSTDSDGDGIQDGTELGLVSPLSGTDLSLFVPDSDPTSATFPLDDDTDNDGIIDGEEDSNANGAQDTDETNPLSTDSDGDGLKDGLEIGLVEPQGLYTDESTFVADSDPSTTTNPLSEDSDEDGLSDAEEDQNYNGAQESDETAAHLYDTDEDGLSDGEELLLETNPLNPDSDEDGLSDAEELLLETNPLIADSDNDGLSDAEEVQTFSTDPLNPDSDNDGVSDSDEVNIYETNPNVRDTDNDGILDGQEIINGTNPNKSDSDEDGYSDGAEDQISNPLDPESTPAVEEEQKSGCSTSTTPVDSLPILLVLGLLFVRSREDES